MSRDLKRSPKVVCTKMGPSIKKRKIEFEVARSTLFCSLTNRSRKDEAELGRDHDAAHRLIVAGKNRPRGRGLSLAYNALGSRIPMPEEDGAIFGTGSNVAIRGYVAFRPRQTCYDAIMSEHDLGDLCRISGEDPEKDSKVKFECCFHFWFSLFLPK